MRIAGRGGYKADANGAEFVGILEKRRDRVVFGAAIVYPFRHLRVRWNRAAMMINNQSYAEGRVARQGKRLRRTYILNRLGQLSAAVERPELVTVARLVLEGKPWRK